MGWTIMGEGDYGPVTIHDCLEDTVLKQPDPKVIEAGDRGKHVFSIVPMGMTEDEVGMVLLWQELLHILLHSVRQ